MSELPRDWMTGFYSTGTRTVWEGDSIGGGDLLRIGVEFETEDDRLFCMDGAIRGLKSTCRFPTWDAAVSWARESP